MPQKWIETHVLVIFTFFRWGTERLTTIHTTSSSLSSNLSRPRICQFGKGQDKCDMHVVTHRTDFCLALTPQWRIGLSQPVRDTSLTLVWLKIAHYCREKLRRWRLGSFTLRAAGTPTSATVTLRWTCWALTDFHERGSLSWRRVTQAAFQEEGTVGCGSTNSRYLSFWITLKAPHNARQRKRVPNKHGLDLSSCM